MKFRLTPKDKRTKLDIEIESVLDQMSSLEANDPLYTAMRLNLSELCAARALTRPTGPSADTILTVAGSLLGIALMLSYEQFHPITSKVVGFVLKPKA